MKPPRVSVLIPNYNGGRFLAETIKSVLMQDFQDYELLIVDNHSTDDSHAVLADCAAKDHRVRYQINDQNLGAARNFNKCLELAQGDYVKLLCSDDKLVSRQALSRLVGILDRHPTVVLASSAAQIMDQNSRLRGVRDPFKRTFVAAGREIILRCLLGCTNCVGEPSAVLFRRTAARRGFDPSFQYCLDMEMWFHLLEQGDFTYTREPLSVFRTHPQQLSAACLADGRDALDHDRLLSEYFARPWLKARLDSRRIFTLAYTFRKRFGRDPEDDAVQAQIQRLGKLWLAYYWLERKLTNPFRPLTGWVRP